MYLFENLHQGRSTPVILCGCETFEHTLRTSGHKQMRINLGPVRDDVTGGRQKIAQSGATRFTPLTKHYEDDQTDN
jgi:hypothetical protein